MSRDNEEDQKHNHDEEGDRKALEDYARRLRFTMHQLAMRSADRTEEEYEGDLYAIGVVHGMPEFDEAKRAWRRFQRKDARSTF